MTMKSKLILDLSIYMISPILLCSVFNNSNLGHNLGYNIAGSIALVIVYSVMCKVNEARVNVSALVLSSLFILTTILKIDINSKFDIYIYDTYFLILLGVSILIFTVLKKDIITRIYIDIQRSKGINNLSIWSNIKKSELHKEFRQLSYFVSAHLIIISFIKVYSVSTYGEALYTTTQNLEVLVSVIFLIGEVYMISKIMEKSKQIKNSKKKRNKSKYNLNNSRVVSLDQYKNANK